MYKLPGEIPVLPVLGNLEICQTEVGKAVAGFPGQSRAHGAGEGLPPRVQTSPTWPVPDEEVLRDGRWSQPSELVVWEIPRQLEEATRCPRKCASLSVLGKDTWHLFRHHLCPGCHTVLPSWGRQWAREHPEGCMGLGGAVAVCRARQILSNVLVPTEPRTPAYRSQTPTTDPQGSL